MKHSSLYKRLFIVQILLVSIHIFSFSGIIRFIGFIIGLLGFLSLISLIFQLFIKPSQNKVTTFHLKDCHVPFPRFARAMEWEDFEKRRINEETPITIPLLVPSLKINDLLHKLLNNVINEFVLTWYNEITPSRSFLYELENEIYSATAVIIKKLKKVNIEDFIGRIALPIIYNHIIEFNQARIRIANINSGNPELKISMYYNHGKLHPAVLPTLSSTQKLEYNHLRNVFEKILPILLDKKICQSRTVVVLIREIVVCKVMQPLLDLLSDPDFYNQQFIDLSERFFGKPDYIQYVNEALGTNSQIKKQNEIPQTYEDFLRMIKECNNLRTACLLRNDIIKEIKLNKAQIANLNRSDIVHGVKVYIIQAYINRIETALKHCEKRIKELGGPDFQKLENNIDLPSSLYDVLATPLGRYYFTQYMNHHHQSHLYNFWMEVQRLRILPEITPANKEIIMEESKSLKPEVDKETIRENVWNIYNTYLFPDTNDFNPKVDMSLEIITAIEIFLYGRPQQTTMDLGTIAENQNPDPNVNDSSIPQEDPDNDYTCIFKAQKYVYDIMESKYYSKFVKSTLYFRFLHDLSSGDEYKNQILQRISNLGSSTNLVLPTNNGKIRGKIKAIRKKRENSVGKKPRRHHRNSGHLGRHNSMSSSSYSDRRLPNRRRSNYSIRKSNLNNIYYNRGLIPDESNQNNNQDEIKYNSSNIPKISVTPTPLNANQMESLSEAINNSITDHTESSTGDNSEHVNVNGKIDNSSQRLSPVTILENYKNNMSGKSTRYYSIDHSSNLKNSNTNDSNHTSLNNSMILPGNKMIYSDPQSIVKNEHPQTSISNSSTIKRPQRVYSRYYSVNEYFQENGNIDDLEEEYVDNFDDDDESILMSSSYSPSMTSYSTRFSINSRNEFHTRRKKSKLYYNSIKRKLSKNRSKDDYYISSVRNDYLHYNPIHKSSHKEEKNNNDNSENEWEDEEDYVFFNVGNLYSYDEIPDMLLSPINKEDNGKSTDNESLAKTVTYDSENDTDDPLKGNRSQSPLPPLPFESNILNGHIRNEYDNHNEHHIFTGEESVYYNTIYHEEPKLLDKPVNEYDNYSAHHVFTGEESVYYNTVDHEEPKLFNKPVNEYNNYGAHHVFTGEESVYYNTVDHEEPNHIATTNSHINSISPVYLENNNENANNNIELNNSNKSIPNINVIDDKKNNELMNNEDMNKGIIEEKRESNINRVNTSSSKDNISDNEKSSSSDKRKSNLSMISNQSNNEKTSTKEKRRSALSMLSNFSDKILDIERITKKDKRKSNLSMISNFSNNDKITENETTSNNKSKRLSNLSMLSNTSNNDGIIDKNEKASNKDKRMSNISMLSNNSRNDRNIIGYSSDGEYDKLDYTTHTNGIHVNKMDSNISTTSTISRVNAVYHNKRDSTHSAFSISNNLKMEMLNNDEKGKEESDKKIDDENDEGSVLYKDKYSLSRKASSESQKSHKGLKKIFNSKIKRKEKKRILEDARKVNYDEEEEEEDLEEARSNRLSVVSDDSLGEGGVSSFHYASPGDLLVSSLIDQVDESMKELEDQKKNIDDLITNAILSKETRRLELLQDAKSQLESHVKDLKKQRDLYIIQARENAITPENVSISISDCHFKHDGNKNYALYIIEVNRTNPNGCTSGWIVTRRYSEFVMLHQQLRNKYWNIVHRYELPGKNMFSWIIPKPDIIQARRVALEKRRVALEKYLRNLISHEEICQSIELRKFISQQNVDMPSFKYKTFNFDEYNDDGVKRNNALLKSDNEGSKASLPFIPLKKENEDRTNKDINIINPQKFNISSKSMPDVFNKSTNNNNNNNDNDGNRNIDSNQNETEQIKKSISLLENHVKNIEKKDETQSLQKINFDGIKGGKIIDGIFDILLELFGIKDKIDWYNWLQHKAFLSFFQQVFSGTLDRKTRQAIQSLISENMIELYLNLLNDTLWPDGEFFINKRNREWEENHIPIERTEEQKKKTKIECYKKLTTQIPEILGGLIGKKKANYGAEFLFELFQNRRLNQHLMYTLFDELFKCLFPEIENIK